MLSESSHTIYMRFKNKQYESMMTEIRAGCLLGVELKKNFLFLYLLGVVVIQMYTFI